MVGAQRVLTRFCPRSEAISYNVTLRPVPRHRTLLTYRIGRPEKREPRPEIHVGEVSCVPRSAQLVVIGEVRYYVHEVTWTVDPDGGPTRVVVDLVTRNKRT